MYEDEVEEEESIMFEHKVITNDVFGYLLVWNALLQKISKGKLKLRMQQDHDYITILH